MLNNQSKPVRIRFTFGKVVALLLLISAIVTLVLLTRKRWKLEVSTLQQMLARPLRGRIGAISKVRGLKIVWVKHFRYRTNVGQEIVLIRGEVRNATLKSMAGLVAQVRYITPSGRDSDNWKVPLSGGFDIYTINSISTSEHLERIYGLMGRAGKNVIAPGKNMVFTAIRLGIPKALSAGKLRVEVVLRKKVRGGTWEP